MNIYILSILLKQMTVWQASGYPIIKEIFNLLVKEVDQNKITCLWNINKLELSINCKTQTSKGIGCITKRKEWDYGGI